MMTTPGDPTDRSLPPPSPPDPNFKPAKAFEVASAAPKPEPTAPTKQGG